MSPSAGCGHRQNWVASSHHGSSTDEFVGLVLFFYYRSDVRGPTIISHGIDALNREDHIFQYPMHVSCQLLFLFGAVPSSSFNGPPARGAFTTAHAGINITLEPSEYFNAADIP